MHAGIHNRQRAECWSCSVGPWSLCSDYSLLDILPHQLVVITFWISVSYGTLHWHHSSHWRCLPGNPPKSFSRMGTERGRQMLPGHSERATQPWSSSDSHSEATGSLRAVRRVRLKRANRNFSNLTPMDCSPPGSPVHGILQARILEWAAIPFSRGSSQPRDRICISYVSCTGKQVLYH